MTPKSDASPPSAEVKHTITSASQSCCRFSRSRYTRWTLKSWIFFFVIIPAILTGIFLLSPEIKNDYFIFHFGCSGFPSMYLNAFVHSALDHFLSNLILYLLSMTVIFLFCSDPRLLYRSSVFILLVLPIIVSWVTYLEFAAGNLQGFSGIVFAYFGLMTWCLVKYFAVDHDPLIQKHKPTFWTYNQIGFIIYVFMTILGLYIGIVPHSEHFTVNNPGHLTGFLFGILVVSLLDLPFATGPKKNCTIIINIWFLLSVVWIWILYFWVFLR